MSEPIHEINVNLTPCTCPTGWPAGGSHFPRFSPTMGCDAAPVMVPLSLEPHRSVTITLRLGKCTCGGPFPRDFGAKLLHANTCPARPIRVTCSIVGETWKESEVIDLDVPGRIAGTNAVADLWRICRERWALVMGASKVSEFPEAFMMIPAVSEMLVQRDAVFAALADLRRTEMAAHAAFLALPMDLRKAVIISKQCGPVAADPEGGIDLPSTKILAAYVGRLIEQVGAL